MEQTDQRIGAGSVTIPANSSSNGQEYSILGNGDVLETINISGAFASGGNYIFKY